MTNYSFFQLVRDVFIAGINSDVAKVLAGALVGLLGTLLSNRYISNRKNQERKTEILETIQSCVSRYFDLGLLILISGNLADFYMKAIDLVEQSTGPFSFVKEEFQRHMDSILRGNEQLVELKGEIHKTYMAYKIYFGRDETLWGLLKDFTEPLVVQLKNYDSADRTNIRSLRDSNLKLIKDEYLRVVKPKSQKVIDYLDDKIKRIDLKK